MKIRTALCAAAGLVLLPTAAFAHTGIGETSGFLHGFSHPVSGLDHVLAMVMVGLFAWQLGGRALWLVPAAFLSVMALGGALGLAGIGLPFVETGIALSVLVLGAVVALRFEAPVAAAVGLVGLFALFHGHAHGAEMPAAAGGFAYAAGFLLATALLHGAGILASAAAGGIGGRAGSILTRSAGGLACIAGAGLLTGLL